MDGSAGGCSATVGGDSMVVAFSVSPGWSGCAGDCLRASFLAYLASRRSRSLLSRVSFAIVVFFLPLEAMPVLPLLWRPEGVLAIGCDECKALLVVEPLHGPCDLQAGHGRQVQRALDELDVRGPGSLVAGLGVVRHLCSVGERAIALTDDRAVMDEQVLGLVIGRDEAKPLVVTEPLDGTGSHCCFLLR